MTNGKAQMTNKAQNPNDKKRQFWHLTCPPGLGRRGIWILIVIWILTFGFLRGNDAPPVIARHDSAEAISVGGDEIDSQYPR